MISRIGMSEVAQQKMNRPINSGKRVDRVDRFSVELSRFVRLDRFQGLPDGRLSLLSARPAVTPGTIKRAAVFSCYQFRCLVNRGTVCVNSLLKTLTRQRRDCDLNPGPSATESSVLTTWLPSHPLLLRCCHEVCYERALIMLSGVEATQWSRLIRQRHKILTEVNHCGVINSINEAGGPVSAVCLAVDPGRGSA